MKVQLKERTDWEGNLLGIYDVYLNGREVGNDANNCLSDVWVNQGLKTIKAEGIKIIGETGTNKTFEIYGGIKAGGRANDWFLEVDGVTVSYANNAKNLIQLLCACTWTDQQVEFSHSLYKKDLEKRLAKMRAV